MSALSVAAWVFAAPFWPNLQQPEAPPGDVAAWLRGAPVVDFVDEAAPRALEPLRAIVGDARIVAIGEATHGSQEFFAFKARAVEFLVRELGFTDVALETGFVNALETNAWVERGEGDLQSALGGLAGMWRTEAYRDLLLWLRAWNEDPSHAVKVRVHGLDMQVHAGEAAQAVRAALQGVDAEVADGVEAVLQSLGRLGPVEEGDLEGLLALFDELEAAGRARLGERGWGDARQTAVVLVQRWRQAHKTGNEAPAFRDRCMADNARWILSGGAGRRLVLSAHNGHVSRNGLFEVPDFGIVQSVGRALTQDRKDGASSLSMVVIGTAFGSGGFLSLPAQGGATRAFELTAPPESAEAALAAVLTRPTLLDLRAAPQGVVRDWLATPRPHVGIGGAWDPDWLAQGQATKWTTLPAEYDALLFVPAVTPARML